MYEFDGDNPPAFPASTIDGFTQHGMSLRDWFAGQALAGLLSDTALRGDPDLFAKVAWEHADAMLAARTALQNDGEGV